MKKIVESGMRDCTVTLDGSECAVEFPANYRVFSVKNMSDSDIIMSVESGKTAADDGVRIVEAGGVGALNHMRSDINTVYITGTGKVQISAGNEAVLPFKAAEKGGDTVSACGNPVQLSGLQGGVPFADIKVKSPNLLPMPYTTDSVDTTGFDVTIHEDGSVDVHGTASTGHYVVYFCNYAKYNLAIKKSKTYRMLCSHPYDTKTNNIVCTIQYESGNTKSVPYSANTFTAEEDGFIKHLTLWCGAGNTVDVDGLWVMLVEDDGTEYADFLPPITGRELTVNVCGKNFLKNSDFTDPLNSNGQTEYSRTESSSAAVITIDSWYSWLTLGKKIIVGENCITIIRDSSLTTSKTDIRQKLNVFLPFLRDQEITVSVNYEILGDDARSQMFVRANTEGGSPYNLFLTDLSKSGYTEKTVKIPSDVTYLEFGIWTYDSLDIYNAQIEIGRSATEFEAYRDTVSYTITPDSNPYTIPNDIRQQEGLNNISVSAGELSVVGVKENLALKKVWDKLDELATAIIVSNGEI